MNKVIKTTEITAKVRTPKNQEWRDKNKTLNRQLKIHKSLNTSTVYMFGTRNRAIKVTSSIGETVITNYKNLEKQGLTHLPVQ